MYLFYCSLSIFHFNVSQKTWTHNYFPIRLFSNVLCALCLYHVLMCTQDLSDVWLVRICHICSNYFRFEYKSAGNVGTDLLDDEWDDIFEVFWVRMGALHKQRHKKWNTVTLLHKVQLNSNAAHEQLRTLMSMSTSVRKVMTSSVTAATFSLSGSVMSSGKLRPSICWLV